MVIVVEAAKLGPDALRLDRTGPERDGNPKGYGIEAFAL